MKGGRYIQGPLSQKAQTSSTGLSEKTRPRSQNSNMQGRDYFHIDWERRPNPQNNGPGEGVKYHRKKRCHFGDQGGKAGLEQGDNSLVSTSLYSMFSNSLVKQSEVR